MRQAGQKMTSKMQVKPYNANIKTSSGVGRAITGKTNRLSGSDFISNVSVSALDGVAGKDLIEKSIRFEIAISPAAIPGTRIAKLSELWERYKLLKFNIRYVPAVPTTLGCQLLAYSDTDPLDDPRSFASKDEVVRQAAAQVGARYFNFDENVVIPLAQRADNQYYYTGRVKENPRFSEQGKFYVIQNTSPVDMSGTPIGSGEIDCGALFVDWDIEFSTPQINPFGLFTSTAKCDFAASVTDKIGVLTVLRDCYILVQDMTCNAAGAVGYDLAFKENKLLSTLQIVNITGKYSITNYVKYITAGKYDFWASNLTQPDPWSLTLLAISPDNTPIVTLVADE